MSEKPDFLALLEPKLVAECKPAIQLICRLLNQKFDLRPGCENKAMANCIFEYLLGLDHTILAYPRDDEDADLTCDEFVIFSGLHDEIIHLESEDEINGTNYGSELRSDNDVANRISDWFDACWIEAGGQRSPIASYWMFEGSSDLYNMQTQAWE